MSDFYVTAGLPPDDTANLPMPGGSNHYVTAGLPPDDIAGPGPTPTPGIIQKIHQMWSRMTSNNTGV